MRPALLFLLATAGGGLAIAQQPRPAPGPAATVQEAVASPTRSPENRARDAFRHPIETLQFFGVRPTDTVVEVWPGGGWYTEILAPYLSNGGRLIVAAPQGRASDGIAKKLAGNAAVYSRVRRANFPKMLGGSGVRPGTADVVLTFRNVHNWRMGSYNPAKTDYAAAAFAEMFAMLKPGGTLGVVDHNLPEGADAALETSSGYIKASTVRGLAEAAGFRFAGASEVNANPKDTHDHPQGVWTLPPSYALKDKDRAKYAAIGESDRFTIKFTKPN